MRKNRSIYIDESVFDAFNRYASLHFQKKMYEVWEETLLERMQSKPVDGLKVSVQQQIAEIIPTKREEINMGIISRRVRTFMELIAALNKDDDASKLKDKLSRWINKGLNIKKPTTGFLSLLEEAIEYV